MRGVKRWIEYRGEVDTLSGWARRVGMSPSLLRERLKRMDMEAALSLDIRAVGDVGEYVSTTMRLTQPLCEGIARYAKDHGVLSHAVAIRALLSQALAKHGITA